MCFRFVISLGMGIDRFDAENNEKMNTMQKAEKGDKRASNAFSLLPGRRMMKAKTHSIILTVPRQHKVDRTASQVRKSMARPYLEFPPPISTLLSPTRQLWKQLLG